MWKDGQGVDRFTTARSIDISESGMSITTPEPITERSYVILRADKLDLHGTASVRHCLRKGSSYVVGLEFSAGLKWKPVQSKA